MEQESENIYSHCGSEEKDYEYIYIYIYIYVCVCINGRWWTRQT